MSWFFSSADAFKHSQIAIIFSEFCLFEARTFVDAGNSVLYGWGDVNALESKEGENKGAASGVKKASKLTGTMVNK